MKKILIPIELSHPEEERKTVLFGARLASQLNMGLVLMNVLYSKTYSIALTRILQEEDRNFNPEELLREKEEYIHTALSNYQKEVRKEIKPAPMINFQIIKSSYAEKYLKLANRMGIEMFLVCWEDLKNQPFSLVDKTNKQILKNGNIPVFIHPSGKQFTPIRKIILGTNHHPPDAEVIHKLSDMFNTDEVEIIVLHISEDLGLDKKMNHSNYIGRIKGRTNNNNIKINTMITREKLNAPNLINSFAIDKDADLVVLLKENEKIAGEVIEASTIQNIAAKSEMPLMVFSA